MKKMLVFIAVLLFLSMAACQIASDQPEVRAGQIWKYHSGSPFDSPTYYYVLEVRGDWIQYVSVGAPDWKYSHRVRWFLIDATFERDSIKTEKKPHLNESLTEDAKTALRSLAENMSLGEPRREKFGLGAPQMFLGGTKRVLTLEDLISEWDKYKRVSVKDSSQETYHSALDGNSCIWWMENGRCARSSHYQTRWIHDTPDPFDFFDKYLRRKVNK